eukprot:2290921-Ditylum_brightwellii.AAC.1
MLVTLSAIAAEQNNSTEDTARALVQLFDYAATNPVAIIQFRWSNIILCIHSNASYLSEKKVGSQGAGYFYLGEEKEDTINGAVLVMSKILKTVMASVAKVECNGVYENCHKAVPLKTALEEMGHPQPATPIITDNIIAEGIMNSSICQKRIAFSRDSSMCTSTGEREIGSTILASTIPIVPSKNMRQAHSTCKSASEGTGHNANVHSHYSCLGHWCTDQTAQTVDR